VLVQRHIHARVRNGRSGRTRRNGVVAASLCLPRGTGAEAGRGLRVVATALCAVWDTGLRLFDAPQGVATAFAWGPIAAIRGSSKKIQIFASPLAEFYTVRN
jgi:hypothetical protein